MQTQGNKSKIHAIVGTTAAAMLALTIIIAAAIPIVEFVQPAQATAVAANQVIDTIQLPEGAHPSGIAFNPDNNQLYVVNFGNGEFLIIDDDTNEVVGSIDMPPCTCTNIDGAPITYDSNNNNMYATFPHNGTVSVVDTSDNTISATIQLSEGAFPLYIAFNPDNNQLYVTDLENSAAHIIDDQTNEVVKTISVGENPWSIAYNPVYKKIYVTNPGSGTVSVINSQTDEVVKTISLRTVGASQVAAQPRGVAVDSSNGRVYVTDPDLDRIYVISGSNDRVLNIIRNIDTPSEITYGSNHVMYVGSPNSVYVINRNILQTTIPLPGAAADIEYDSHNQNVYVTDHNSGAIYVISTTGN
jgi:YVTN family beta-propeller protein